MGKKGRMNTQLCTPMGGLRMAWDGIADRRVEVGGRYWNGDAVWRVEGRNGLTKPFVGRREIRAWGSRSASVREGCRSRSADVR